MTDRVAAPEPRSLRVLVAQIDLTVADFAGNTARIVEVLEQARAAGVDLAVFPELAVSGYPPEDLLLRPSFLAASEKAIETLGPHTAGLTAIVGFAHRDRDLFNAAAILHDGQLRDVYHKVHLPNYSVFDEARYFRSGDRFPVYVRAGVRIGVSICEDIWQPVGPPQFQALAGAEVLVNVSASPYFRGKGDRRERMLATRAADSAAFVVFCNLVGGQDELVFDGHSLVIGPDGCLLDRGASFAEDVFIIDLPVEEAFRQRLLDPRHRQAWPVARRDETPEIALPVVPPTARVDLPARSVPPVLDPLSEVYAALVLGTGDYVRKNAFRDVVVGLSGGIDSALVAAVAVDAVGAEHVVGVTMPTRYSSAQSAGDAADLAANLGFRMLTIPIDDLFQAYLDVLDPLFEGRAPDVTEENLQPRIRGNLLMALSNKLGYLVLTTGNKSETSVGYVTLYGDSAGGFAPLKDVPKTLVYDLARWRNARAGRPHIPEHSLTRPPTAELRPDQLDSDSLPPYEVLDPILAAYVEDEKSTAEIVAMGNARETVDRVLRMVDAAEYKRRQSPPGIKITDRAFGRDRRMPITRRGGG
jgi:NAD+ synthase (glutamine-hydrolysing)